MHIMNEYFSTAHQNHLAYLLPCLPICLCLFLSKNFNILSALVIHQRPTLPQIIDSREGLFGCKKGLVVNAGKMNLYSLKAPFALDFGLFAAKCNAFWC